MKADYKEKLKRCLSIITGILIALLFSVPYIVFRKQIQDMSVFGYISLIVACAISNVSVFLPSSSTLIVVAAASTLNPLLCVFCGGIGTCLGEQSSYICGRIGRMGFDNSFSQNRKVLEWLKKREFVTIFVFAFVPLPIFDVIGVASGAMRVKWTKYTIAAVLGKTLKFLSAIVGIYCVIPIVIDILPDSISSILQHILEQFGLVY